MADNRAPTGVTWIALNHGKHALIDIEDLPRVAAYTWYAYYDREREQWLATRTQRTDPQQGAPRKTVWMHRFILDAAPGSQVTHRSGDGLDNRKTNLRLVTATDKGGYRRRNRQSTSGYRGVSWHAGMGKWRAILGHQGKKLHLGFFVTAEEAARTYDVKAREVFGEQAYQNFPRGAHEESRTSDEE